MAIACAKAMPPTVEFARLDAYALDGLDEMDARSFDAAFAGCWWSHVPLQRLAGWVGTLHARLAPGARVVVLDNRFVAGSSTPLTRRDAHGNTYQQRSLDDGSTHEVLKNFPDAQALRTVLGEAATDFAWTAWTHYWAATWTVAGSGVGPAGV